MLDGFSLSLILDASVKIYHENSVFVKIYHENSVFVKIGPISILTIFVNCQASSQTMSTVHAGLCMLCFFTTHCSLRLIVRSELDVPTLATRRLHARAPSGGRWNCGRENVRDFCLNVDFHVTFRDLLHAVKLRHGTDGFTSPPKDGVLRIFPP